MAELDGPSRPLERVPTGIPGLDTVLHGGFLRGDMYLIVGAPGAGKTVLSNQICFAHVANGGRAVYVTLLSESHERLLAHLQSFPFFNPAPLTQTLNYFSGFRLLEEGGLAGLLGFLRAVMAEHHVTLLVIDSLMPVQEAALSPLAFNRFLHDLGTASQLQRCTTVLLSQSSPRREHTEYTILDGVLALDHSLLGTQAVRELQMLKFRGSGFLPGRHAFTIGREGVTVYPLTEERYAHPAGEISAARTRLRFGIRHLDELLGGGLLSGTNTMLLGAPGSGKTLLGLHFLASGARDGQPGLHFGFYETPTRLAAKANELGLGFGQHVVRKEIALLWQAPLGVGLDPLAERLLEALERTGARRLVIDGLEGFQQAAVRPERLGRFLIALANELRQREVTTLLTAEQRDWPGDVAHGPLEAFVPVVDNVLLVRRVAADARWHRLLAVLKQQESRFSPEIRELDIGPTGLTLAATADSARAILRGERVPQAESEIGPVEDADEGAAGADDGADRAGDDADPDR